MDSIIYTRIKELCAERKISISRLEIELGFGQYSIGSLKNSTNPTIKTIVSVASYFGVSVDYLIGASDIRTKADELVRDSDFVSIQRARERMTGIDRDRMTAMIQIAFSSAFDEKNASIEKYVKPVIRTEHQALGTPRAEDARSSGVHVATSDGDKENILPKTKKTKK